MRVHRLVIEAFGPFAERVEVDLDDLGSAGLFLIHGPTGAGKSSLLDAICYALYANVPGSRTKKGLRSDHAPLDRVPRVTVEFTASGGRYRLTRSPEFQRPKLRGSGVVDVPAKVSLEMLTGRQWQVLSTSHTEVADRVLDLVGMGLAQFSKVVILPQGEFAAFLRAGAEERRELLERLFDVTAYADVEAWLVERRKSSTHAADLATEAVTTELVRLDDILMPHSSSAAPGESGGGDAAASIDLTRVEAAALASVLGDLLEVEDAHVSTAMAHADACALAERAAAGALTAARQRAEHRARGDLAHQALVALAAQEGSHRERLAEVDAARRAHGLAGHLAARARADRRLAQATLRVEDRVAALTTHGISADTATITDRLQALRGLDDEAGRLGLVADRLAAITARHTTLTAELNAAEHPLENLVTTRSRQIAAAEEAARVLAATTASVAELPCLDTEFAEIARLRAALRRLREHEAKCARLADARRSAHDLALMARSAHLDLRARHLDGIAAELAQTLADGCPCPVCGSTDHPDAASTSDPVDRGQLESAEETAQDKDRELREIELRLSAAEATVAACRLDLGDTDEAGLIRREAQADESRERATTLMGAQEAASAAHLSALEVLERTTQAIRQLTETTVSVRAVVAELDLELQALLDQAQQLAEVHAPCPCSAGDVVTVVPVEVAHETVIGSRACSDLEDRPTVGDPLGRHQLVRSLLTEAHEALAEFASATTEADAVRTGTDDALAQGGFGDIAEAELSMRTADQLASLERAIRHHGDEHAAVSAVLEDPVVVSAQQGDPDDIDALTETDRLARQELLQSTRAQTSAEARRATLASAVPTIVSRAEGRDALRAEAHRIRELADTVSGLGANNPLRMRLAAYVLAARLERIVAFANERLTVLGSGRYLLEHTDEKTGAARSGLGLQVNDLWTGRVRATNTLSGGETFMASLALALGLADAVSAEAGGRDLGMLFVDEGFGSLDDESLEEVMAVLDGLQEGGRSVGVVSHVADLRTRIPHQLVVTRTPDGSFVTARTGSDHAA